MWWLDERCFAVEQVGEEPHALRAHNLARVLVDECICAVTQDSSFRHLHVLELFTPHGFHRKPPQRRYGAYVSTDRHVFLLNRISTAEIYLVPLHDALPPAVERIL